MFHYLYLVIKTPSICPLVQGTHPDIVAQTTTICQNPDAFVASLVSWQSAENNGCALSTISVASSMRHSSKKDSGEWERKLQIYA